MLSQDRLDHMPNRRHAAVGVTTPERHLLSLGSSTPAGHSTAYRRYQGRGLPPPATTGDIVIGPWHKQLLPRREIYVDKWFSIEFQLPVPR